MAWKSCWVARRQPLLTVYSGLLLFSRLKVGGGESKDPLELSWIGLEALEEQFSGESIAEERSSGRGPARANPTRMREAKAIGKDRSIEKGKEGEGFGGREGERESEER